MGGRLWRLVIDTLDWIGRYFTIIALVGAGGVAVLTIAIVNIFAPVTGLWRVSLGCGVFVLAGSSAQWMTKKGWIKTLPQSTQPMTTTNQDSMYRLNNPTRAFFTQDDLVVRSPYLYLKKDMENPICEMCIGTHFVSHLGPPFIQDGAERRVCPHNSDHIFPPLLPSGAHYKK